MEAPKSGLAVRIGGGAGELQEERSAVPHENSRVPAFHRRSGRGLMGGRNPSIRPKLADREFLLGAHRLPPIAAT